LVTDLSGDRDQCSVSPALAESPPPSSAGAATEASWADLYEAHAAFVWRSLRRLGVDASSVDDATQDVFLVAFQRHAEFEGRSSYRTWLYGIAFHVAQRFARATARSAAEPFDEGLVDTTGLSPQEALARTQAVRRLYAVLEELEYDRRVVFVMTELEQMSAPEIAELTRAPLNTVYSRLRGARKDFDAALKRLQAKDDWRKP
jgi:RNA polymerase sigma-70 factor (ECF subfamily)